LAQKVWVSSHYAGRPASGKIAYWARSEVMKRMKCEYGPWNLIQKTFLLLNLEMDQKSLSVNYTRLEKLASD
jgi:hypothetical protein